MREITKRSHYLPQTYLKHFLKDDSLFMYKKGEKFFKAKNMTPQQRILQIDGEANVKNIALENNLYNPEAEGITTNEVEEIFQEFGENFLNKTICEIEKTYVPETRQDLSTSLKERLSMFLASMRVRTPLFKWEIETSSTQMHKFLMKKDMENTSVPELERRMKSMGKTYTKDQLRKAKDMFINQEYSLKWPNAHFLKFALGGLQMHLEIFSNMKMLIGITRPDRFLITSDNPVVYFVPKEKTNFYNQPKSLMSLYTELFFPLTKNIGIHISRHRAIQEGITDFNREVSDTFNFNIATNSLNFIFSPIKMKFLNKYIENHIPYPFEFKIH